MQHDGWLETLLQSRFPKHELVFRNLGFSGDEVGGFTDRPDFNQRLRSADFGSSDGWLTRHQGRRGLRLLRLQRVVRRRGGADQFKKDLEAFIKHTLAQKYNGKSAPRSSSSRPSPTRTSTTPTCPTARKTTSAWSCTPPRWPRSPRPTTFPSWICSIRRCDLYAKAAKPLTINGVHLTAEGNQPIAQIIDAALFPNGPEPKRDPEALEKLRQAVLDKNFYWFNRYRTVDGYQRLRRPGRSRSSPDEQTNCEVASSARWKSST